MIKHGRIRLTAAVGVLSCLVFAPGIAASAPRDIVRAACSVPAEQLERTLRGFRLDHSGDLQIFTPEPDYVGSGLPHIAPFDYIQDVPIVWYGPGFIRPKGEIKRPAFVTDIPATQAELLHFDDFRAPDGRVMEEALEPVSKRAAPPRLIVTVVWDAAGNVVLEEWNGRWPFLRSLGQKGAWYSNATIGSAPASTAQIHAEIGTGAFPRSHGVVGHHYRIGVTHAAPWKTVASMPVLPTLADLYDRAHGNRPEVVLSGTVAIHMGMMSHGALWGGGDKDIAILREADNARTLGAEGIEWKLPPTLQEFFAFPLYANKLPSIDTYFREADMMDGRQDGWWRGFKLEPGDAHSKGGFDTPARIPYQQKLVEELVKREDLGQDDVPDLLFVNYKLIDTLAHIGRGLNGRDMGDAVEAQDRYLKKFVEFLNREVGERKWVMVLTADHGATPHPAESGAFVISPGKVGSLINEEFDRDGDDRPLIGGDGADIGGVGGFVQPTQIFLDHQELEDNNVQLEDVARFVMRLPKEQVAENAPPPAAERNEPAFVAAVPADMLPRLPCLKND